MTLDEFFRAAYRFGDGNALALLLICGLAYPVVATLLSMAGKGGKTDKDGKVIASVFVGAAMVLALAEIVGVFIAVAVYDASLIHASIALLCAPAACLVLTLVGVKLVFPLNQLATFRTAGDLLLLALLCGGLIWFFSKFRGWGILFFGSIFQLIVILGVVLFFIWRIFRRTFGLSGGGGA